MQLLTHKIEEIRKLIVDSHSPFLDELSSIEEDFRRMAQFFEQGNIDPQLENIYGELLRRCDTLARNLRYYGLTQGNPFYQKTIQSIQGDYTLDLEELQNRLEDFTVDISMLELEAEEKRAEKKKEIYARHHEYRTRMFAKVLLANGLSKDNANALQHIILSSSIDTVDAQLLIAALMLSCMNVFDERKAEILYNIYVKADAPMALSQKAVVAFVLCIGVKPDTFDLSKYPIDPQLLATIQQQLLYTIDSPRVEKIMQSEIMPDVVKNSEFDFRNNRIVRRDRDKTDEIINPNKDEENMEKLEETMRKMKEMQEQGSDLFFSGFRYVKQHPFFNLVPNWFCPFYIDHPQLPEFTNPADRNIILSLIDKTPFCESDKYSFVVSMHKVIATIPENMKEMLRHGQAELGIVGGGNLMRNEAYIRRIFLQDVYRFFKLCHWAKFVYNPLFSEGNGLVIKNFLNTGSGEYDITAISTCRTLRKLGFNEEYTDLLNAWSPQTDDGKIFKAFSLISLKTGVKVAIELLEEVLSKDNHNVQALFGMTKACFESHLYKRHFQPYKKDALNSLLALHFNKEDDISVLHNLVKAYILNGDNEKAAKYSEMLIETGKAEAFVFIFLGLYNVSTGDIQGGIKHLIATKKRPEEIEDCRLIADIPLSKPQLDMIYYLMRIDN